METLWMDLRVGGRSLLRRPGLTLFATLLLAVGIGAGTAVFVLLDAVFLHPLRVSHPERIVAIFGTTRNASGELTGYGNLSYPDYLDLCRRSRQLSGLALYQVQAMSLASGGQAERMRGMFVSANYFEVLGLRPARGRFFLPEEGAPGSFHTVAVLSHAAWIRLFGADPEILGRKLLLNGRGFEVVGIAPDGFQGTDFTRAADVWVPLPTFGELSSFGEYLNDRGYLLFSGLGRLQEGVRPEAGKAELASIARQLATEYPEDDGDQGLTVVPLLTAAFHPKDRGRYVGFGRTLTVCFGLVLLVVCSSVGNLLLVRGFESLRELAIRGALGAGRWRAIRPYFCESMLLFVLGGLASLPVARWSLDVLWSLRPPELAQARLDLGLGAAALGFALLLTLGTCLVFALLPAVRVLRPEHLSLFRSSSPGGARRWFLRGAPVAIQVALALVALVAANVFLHSLRVARAVDLGFDPERMAVVTVAPGDQGYDEARGRELYRTLLERIRALPGVRAATASENRLLRGAVLRNAVYRDGEQNEVASGENTNHRINVVIPGFFQTVGIPLLAGRDFQESDCATCPRVVVINRTMAEALWPGENAIGRRIHLTAPDAPPVEVVGVVENARYREVFENPQFFLYLPLSQSYVPLMTLHVRTSGDPANVLPAILRTAKEIDPQLPLADAGTMEGFIANALWFERITALLLGALGGLALLLAVVGIYAAASYSVSRRTREMGVRLALGATRPVLQWLVLRETGAVVGLGILAGWAVALFGLSTLIAGQLHGIDPKNPMVYAAQALVLLAAGLLGGYFSSRRILKIEPAIALRSE